MNKKRPGNIFIICGPTAVGKGTLVALLRDRVPNLFVSCSATTRSPRPGERDGIDYRFLTVGEFQALIGADEMLEWAQVHGEDYYGTPAEPVLAAAAAGRDVILEIDLAGARLIRERLPDAISVFILPPSWEELERRLQGRGTETDAQQARRLETALAELSAQDEFDLRVVNDDLERAAEELRSIILNNRL